MRQETSTLSPFEELVVVKGAMELGFLPPNTIESYLKEFYQALKEGKSYSLLGMLTKIAGISESQIDFLKDGVQEDRENNQLPPPIDIRNHLAVENFLGLAAKKAQIGSKPMAKPIQSSPLSSSKIASVLQARTLPAKSNEPNTLPNNPLVKKSSTPTGTIAQKITTEKQQLTQEDSHRSNNTSIGKSPVKTTVQSKEPAISSASTDTVSIACPDCQFRYRIRRGSKSNKFRCVQCKISFYVIPRNPMGNSPQDWIITKSLPENIFATKTMDLSSIGLDEATSGLEETTPNLLINKTALANLAPKPTAVSPAPKPVAVASVPKPAIVASAPKPAAVASVPKPAAVASVPKPTTVVPTTRPVASPAATLKPTQNPVSKPASNLVRPSTSIAESSKTVVSTTQTPDALEIPSVKNENWESTIEINPDSWKDEDSGSISEAADVMTVRTAQEKEDSCFSTMELDIRGTDFYKKTQKSKTTKDAEYENIPEISTQEIASKNIEELTAHLSDVEAAAIVRHALSYDLITSKDAKTLLDNYFRQYEQDKDADNLATLLVKDGHITKYQYATLKNYVDKDNRLNRLPNYLDILERRQLETYLGIFEQKQALKVVCPYCQAKFIARINVNGGKFKCGRCHKKFFLEKPK